jgi:hypothetical protein
MKQMIASWSMVMVHALMVAGLVIEPIFTRSWGAQAGRGARNILGSLSNVVDNQAGYLARPTTKAPETQIYFTKYRSGAFPTLRLRTVVRGERASRSIVNRTTALWSIYIVASLILAYLALELVFVQTRGREDDESRGFNGVHDRADRCPGGLDGLYHHQTEGNEHKLGSCLVEFFSRPPSAGRRLRFRRLSMKTGLELI